MQTETTSIHPANGHTTSERRIEAQTVSPPVDVYENDREILIVVDLPGVAPSAIDVSLDGATLTLEGRRDGKAPLVFRRAFHVPNIVDPDRMSARMEAGILQVRLEKRDEARPRKIEVQNGN